MGEYLNGETGKDWPHVDNFAAARKFCKNSAAAASNFKIEITTQDDIP